MRTTVRLDPDIKSAVERLQQSNNISLSDAINTLARNGLERRPDPPGVFVQRTVDLGLRLDVSNVAEALDLLDGVDHT